MITGETDSELDSEDENHEINGPYRSSDYENLFHLITHSEKVAEADTIAFSTSACLLLYYLKISNYFGSSGSFKTQFVFNVILLLLLLDQM